MPTAEPPAPKITKTPGKVSGTPCEADANTLCIDDEAGDRRFRVLLRYESELGGGVQGEALATSLAPLGFTDGGILSFFDISNPEVMVKIVDGCGFNDHYWVFYAAATNLGFQITVEDTQTGAVWGSENPDQTTAQTVLDNQALAVCEP